MKRTVWLAVLLALFAMGVFAASSRFSISANDLKDGETKTFGDGDRTITVHRSGDAIDVKINGASTSKRIVIDSTDGEIHIGGDGPRAFSFNGTPGAMPRIFIDGNMPSLERRKLREKSTQTWYVCPKDHTMLRIPDGKSDATYKCPVDGTTMEKREGRGFTFFYDDEWHQREDL